MLRPWSRLWLAIPESWFRVGGAAIFFGYVLLEAQRYAVHWPWLGYGVRLSDGRYLALPYVTVLVDLTMLSVAIGYCVRTPPRARARGFGEVLLPFIAAFWPMTPFLLLSLFSNLAGIDAETGRAASAPAAAGATLQNIYHLIRSALATQEIGVPTYLLGCGLIALGNVIDIWGYLTLRRSISIVAEARELVTHGPYRWVRHPIYLGQFIAQAGVWLVLQQGKPYWALFYAVFVAMQLYRSRVEERVLHEAFGERFHAWRQRAYWPLSG